MMTASATAAAPQPVVLFERPFPPGVEAEANVSRLAAARAADAFVRGGMPELLPYLFLAGLDLGMVAVMGGSRQ